MPEAERKLGAYTLVTKIGIGGFGVVWLAEKRTAIATTRFALKLPRGQDIDLDAFKQEAAIWLHASGHPNVLPLIDADIYDEQVVIVSEYVTDGSLGGWLKQHGGKSPNPDAAVEMMDGVLAGLNHLHERRIIHRDLKPENILLQRDTPRLADFGIARLLKSTSHSAHVSGTLAYMAPEAFDGKRNEQTDIWSVGVIFYEMLSGRLPYDQPDMVAFIGAIMRHDPPPLPASVPEVLRKIVMKALERDPAHRYSSASEMRRDLREAEHHLWLGGRQTDVAPEPPAGPAKAPVAPPIEPTKPREPQPTVPFTPAVTEPYIAPVKQTLRSETIAAPAVPRRRGKIVLVFASLLLLPILLLTAVYFFKRLPDQSRQTLTGHATNITSVAFSPDGKYIASGSTRSAPTNALLEIWDAKTGKAWRTWNGHELAIRSVAFSPDGKTLASAASDSLKLWDVQTGGLKRAWAPYNYNTFVYSVAFSPDGRTLATGSQDNMVRLWDIETGELRRTFAGHTERVTAVAFSPDGKTLASGSDDKNVKLWNVNTGGAIVSLVTASGVSSIAFSPDGQKLASASRNDEVILWPIPIESGQISILHSTNHDSVLAIAFSPYGSLLAGATLLGKIEVWDVTVATPRLNLTGHRMAATSVAFSPDGKTLASGSDDMTVKLWNIP